MTLDNDLLDEILLNSPSNATLRIILRKLADQGQYGRVIQEANKALQSNPKDLEMMLLLADAYKKAGFLGQAEDLLGRICSELDSLAPAFKDLAKIYASQNRNADAVAAMHRYLAHCPQDDDAVALLQDWDKTQQVPAEEETPPEQVALTSPEPEPQEFVPSAEASTLQELATPTLAEIYFNQGQIDDAIQIYENVLARHPDDFEAAKRLDELRAMVSPQEQETETPQKETPFREDLLLRKQKMIAVLSSWLGKIQEMNRAL